jgi:hypothetical protein
MLIARRTTILCISLLLNLTSAAQQKPSPLSPYVKEDAPVLVLEHVRLIDGTGSALQEDMRIDIAGRKITAVQAASAHSPYPPNAKVLEMTGKTVIPGLVGMHEHPFYPTPQKPEVGVAFYGEAPDSAPRLYLAGGVTTARTAGSLEPYTDLELKREIDAGLLPRPKLDASDARKRLCCRPKRPGRGRPQPVSRIWASATVSAERACEALRGTEQWLEREDHKLQFGRPPFIFR